MMYADAALTLALTAVALPALWSVVETWPVPLSGMQPITRRDVSSCDAVLVDVPNVKDNTDGECFGIIEAVDGLTWAGNGWSNIADKNGDPIGMVPLLHPSTTNGISFILAAKEDKSKALKKFTLEYTTDAKPKLNGGKWQAFEGVAADASDCKVSGEQISCTRMHRRLAITWSDTKISAVRISVQAPDPFLLTELTVHNC